VSPDDFPIETNALCEVCRVFGERQWCLATSGNFSARVGDKHCVITQSGKEKSRLSPDDLMICDLDGAPVDRKLKPSNETPLHSCLYKLDPGIGAVLHTHSASATVLSRAAGAEITITGFEMQKAFAGIKSHDEKINVVIFDNDIASAQQHAEGFEFLFQCAWQERLART
jgi:methylthioribulose-1-phosphate dehydratase